MKDKIEKLYIKFIDKPLDFVDKGQFFNKGIYYYFMLITLGILIGGLYFVFSSFPKYIEYLERLEVIYIILEAFASLITLVISIVAVCGLTLLFYKRAIDLMKKDFNNGLLEYIYKEISPMAIRTYGECLALITIVTAVITFIGALFYAASFNPLNPIQSGMMVGIDTPSGVGVFGGYGNYFNNLLNASIGLLTSSLIAFSILIVSYIAVEVYHYLVKIIVNIVKFIPKFALPIWVQRSTRNSDRPTIDINDI
jgi:hypothetical protein